MKTGRRRSGSYQIGYYQSRYAPSSRLAAAGLKNDNFSVPKGRVGLLPRSGYT
jgi:hypothetical protein